MYIDNCSGNNRMKEILEAAESIRTNILYVPANKTEMAQSCDALVIKIIKKAWRSIWDECKLSLIPSNTWSAVLLDAQPWKIVFTSHGCRRC